MTTYETWVNDVLAGKIITNDYIRLACERWRNDHANATERGIYFDRKAAARVIAYVRKFKHTKGEFAGQQFNPEPWQEFYLANVYGWFRVGGVRRFNFAYLDIGRKNGKTAIAAIQGLYGLFGDKEMRAEVYCAATKEDQARYLLDEAKAYCRTLPGWKEIFNIFTKAITVEEVAGKYYDSTFKPLGRDSDTQDGLNPSTAVVDEFHAHKDDSVLNVIQSGMGARKNPLVVIITTAGFNRTSPCYAYRDNAIKVLNGVIEQDTLFAMIFTLDEGDEWTDPATWLKSNPNLNIAVKDSFLKTAFKEAVNMGGTKEVNFKTKHLNIWTDAADTWIQDHLWQKCDKGPHPDLTGYPCYGGLDLASVRDITALSLIFYVDGAYIVKLFCFIPEEKLQNHSDQVDYFKWVQDGHIIVTPGNVTDYSFIHHKIIELKAKYKIRYVAYDRWNASQLVIDLGNEGVKMEPYGQGFQSMSAPTKELEKLVLDGSISHAGNPVLRWMMANVAIHRDAADNYKPAKDKSTGKIDGVVAMVMSLGCLMQHKHEKGFIYNRKGIRSF